jgi:hypothetical protein
MKRSLLFLLGASLLLSCAKNSTYPAGYCFKREVNIIDTAGYYNIAIFTRFPDTYSKDYLNVIVDIVVPEGGRYADTLKLPVHFGNSANEWVYAGRWRDIKWSYRGGIKFSIPGIWKFYVRQIAEVEDGTRTGEIGFIIEKDGKR